MSLRHEQVGKEMNIISKWEQLITGSLLASAAVLYLQIPHTLSAADCFLSLGLGIIHYHPVLDFFLYGIDLLEVVPIVGVTLALIARLKAKKKKN